MDKNTKKLAQEWLDTAESDFQYAKIGLEEHQVYPQIAFLSQQTAEKYLKAFLVINRKEPPRIHDLTKLLDLCIKVKPELDTLRDACELLTAFYIESRYPPDLPEYTKTEILEAFGRLKRLKN